MTLGQARGKRDEAQALLANDEDLNLLGTKKAKRNAIKEEKVRVAEKITVDEV